MVRFHDVRPKCNAQNVYLVLADDTIQVTPLDLYVALLDNNNMGDDHSMLIATRSFLFKYDRTDHLTLRPSHTYSSCCCCGTTESSTV